MSDLPDMLGQRLVFGDQHIFQKLLQLPTIALEQDSFILFKLFELTWVQLVVPVSYDE